MSHRFYFPELVESSSAKATKPRDQVELTGDQAHHAVQVMRFKTGDSLVLFDGRGHEATCEVIHASKKSVQLEVQHRQSVERKLAQDLTLAVALPKGERQKFLIEKLVELGVRTLVPLVTQRGVAVVNDKVLHRINKQVIEASKQCERSWLMEVESPMTMGSLSQWASQKPDGPKSRWIAHPYEGAPIAQVASQQHSGVLVAIGPEGGFDDDEIAEAKLLGFLPIRLGRSILRIETAAMAAAVAFGIASKTA